MKLPFCKRAPRFGSSVKDVDGFKSYNRFIVLSSVTSTTIPNLLKGAGLCASTSDARRMIKQSAVKCDGKVITDKSAPVEKGSAIWQVGKRRFAKVTVA